MINLMKTALIKKDLHSITANKQLFSNILIVPLVLAVIVPSIFVLLILFMPEASADFQKMFELLPLAEQSGNINQTLIKLILNNIMPVFFLIIPIMASSVMAASSFVGEKEKRTLETLLYCPLSLKQIFHSKVLASFLMSMIVSFTSFFAMVFVVEIELFLAEGHMIMPDANWLVILLLLSPAISMIAITLIVRGSAKAHTVEEAQQRSVFLIMPLILLIVGQFTGILLVSSWILLGLSVILVLIALLLMKNAIRNLNYETLFR